MSFFERAKAAASDLAAKADAEMKKAGISTPGSTGVPGTSGGAGGDRALRDLGVLAYLEANGRPVSPADRERVLSTLRELESSGRLGPLTLGPPAYGSPGAPPPPPGAVASGATPPPPPPGATPPPPPPSYAGGAPAAPPPPPPPRAAADTPGTTPPDPTPPDPTPPGSTPPPPPPSWA